MKSSSCQVDASGAGGEEAAFPQEKSIASGCLPQHLLPCTHSFFSLFFHNSTHPDKETEEWTAHLHIWCTNSVKTVHLSRFGLYRCHPVTPWLATWHDFVLNEPHMKKERSRELTIWSRYKRQVHKVWERSMATTHNTTQQLPVQHPSNFNRGKKD